MTINFVSPPVQVIRSHMLGETILFAVDQPRDHVQSHHYAGRFYEVEELMIMSKVFPIGGSLLDIGANVGNHTVFFGKIMKAQRILPIEVNPRVLGVLRTNIVMNGLETVCDLRHLGKGLHSETVIDASITFRERNIGGARVALDGGSLTLVQGDALIQSPFDLVKIDVEGAEMNVLAGLQTFFDTHRPHLFIEVDNPNADDFLRWTDRNDYAVVEKFQRYKENVNYLLSPNAN